MAKAGTFYWDPDLAPGGNTLDGVGLGGGGTWDTVANQWWDGLGSNFPWPNTVIDEAIFTGPYVAGPATPSAVTVSTGVTANRLVFRRSGYSLAGGDISLAGTTPTVHVNLGHSATVASQILGSAGLTKTGGGTLRLTNPSNSYTGGTTIGNGVIAIGDNAALGVGDVVVNGSATRGFGGGALRLEGGVNLARNITLQGQGPLNIGGSLISLGDNTVSGLLATGGATLVTTAVSSTNGRLILSNVNLAGAANTNFLNTGISNSGGVGIYEITGTLSGTGNINKVGGGTLILSPSDASGFGGVVRVGGGTVRIAGGVDLGTNAGTGTSSTIQLTADSAILEVRSDTTNFGKTVYQSGTSNTMFGDHAIGSSAINQTATFGNLAYEDGETLTLNGRNGAGFTFGAAPVVTGDGNSAFANNLNGLLTFTGNFWSNSNSTGRRTMTVSGNGNTLIDGNIIASGAAHSFIKSGTGTLTITGTASTYTGNTTVTGRLSVADLGAINGASTTGSVMLSTGQFQYTGATGVTLAKPFSMISTTGSNAVLSDGAGALQLTGNMGAAGAGAKTFYLGGSNADDNILSGIILDNTSTNLTNLAKIGSGKWVLTEPTGNFGVAGVIAVAAPGTTSTTIITLSSGTTAGLVVGQTVDLLASLPQITGILDSTRFTINTGVTTSTVPAGNYNVAAIPVASTATVGGLWSGSLTIANGTLELRASNAASNVVNSSGAVIFNVDALNANQAAGGTLEFVGVSGSATTETLGALTPTAGSNTVKLTTGGLGAAANLIFTSLGTVGRPTGTNFDTVGGGGGTVTINTGFAPATATVLPGAGHLYLNGSDFANSDGSIGGGVGGAVVAPSYTDGGLIFTTALASLTSARHNLLTGTYSQGAVTISSLKIGSSQTLTLIGNLTINQGATTTDGNILVTGGSTVAEISGGSLITTGGTGGIVIRVDDSGDSLQLNANIGSSTTGGLVKNGEGTLIVNAVNAQTGTTVINEGTVRLLGTGRLSGVANLVIRDGAVLDLNGVSSGTAIAGLDGAGTIRTSTGAATLTVGNSTTGAGTFTGIMEDGGGVLSVSVTGTTGAPVWSGMNTYTGVTRIGTGLATTAKLVSVNTLANIGTASSIGRGNSTDDTTNAASLVFGGLATAGINYTGLTSTSTDRLFTLSGNFAGAGGQIANSSGNSSALIFSKTNAISFGVGLTFGQTLTLGGTSTADNRINLQIVNNAALATSVNKIGAGKWVMGNSSNSYTGLTTITDGTLELASPSSLPTASGLLLGATTTSGVLETSGNFTRDLSTVGTAGNNTVSWNGTTGGGGFAASTGKLVVAIGGLASPTALTWGANGFVPTGASLIFGSATALNEVEFRNAINLAGAVRSISMTDNGNTNTDFATMSGVISGTGGISKVGSTSGVLRLEGANTYDGITAITAGTLVVSSLGNTGDASSSVGIGGSTDLRAITLGNGGTTGGSLQYVGAGEISDRMIRLNTTTGTNIIYADGSGPLILSNVINDMVAGNKSLALRGTNTDGNMITNQLTDFTGTLGVVVDGSAVWILTNATNSFTGITDITQGALGLGADTAFGTGTVRVRNGSLFAYGADRTLANPIQINTTTTQGTSSFIGDYSLNLTAATWDLTNTTTGHIITNGIVAGKTLTIAGTLVLDDLTESETINFSGTGDTIFNGAITTSTALNVGLTYSGTGTLTLTAPEANSDRNAGNFTVSSGRVIIGANEVIASGAGVGSVVINPAAGVTAILDLNGKTETINGLTATSAGTSVIDNTSSTAASLIFGANDATVTFGAATGTFSITDSGTGALSITKVGTGTATITGPGTTLTYQGATNVLGGTLNVGAVLNGTTSVTVENGATVNLVNGAGNPLSLNTFSLGTTGGAMLGFELGASNALSDNLTASGVASAVNTIQFNINPLVGFGTVTTYDLLTAAAGSGLNAANYIIGSAPGGYTYSFIESDTQVQLSLTALLAGSFYWTGDATTQSWSNLIGGNSNFSTDPAGAVEAGAAPGALTTVNFSATNAGAAAKSTTLDNPFSIAGLNILSAVAGDVTIASGAGGVLSDLTIGAGGIDVQTSAPALTTISAPVVVGSAQAWNVTDPGSTLTISGAVSGTPILTKNGAGTLVLSGDFAAFSGNIVNNAGVLNVARTGTFTVSNLISGAGALTKSAAGIMTLDNDSNSFTGPTTITGGTLAYTTIGNVGAVATSMGAPTTALDGTITIGPGTLSFVGSTSQATNRLMTLTASSTLDASGTGGATINYGGALTVGTNFSLTLTGTGTGILSGLMTQAAGTTADLNKNGTGTWTLTANNIIRDDILVNAGTLNINSLQTVNDDMVVTGATTIVNINVAGAFGGDDLFIRGSTVKLGVNGAVTSTVDDLNVSVDSASGGVLDIAGTTGSAPTELILGNTGFSGSIIDSLGGGTIGAGSSFNFRNGSVSAVLVGAGRNLNKTTVETVTLSGVNTHTGITTITDGVLSVATIGNGGVAGNLGQASSAATQLVFNGANSTLRYTGADASTNRSFTINPGQQATFDVTTNKLTVSGASTATNGILNKAGAGTLELSGTNLHTGATNVNEGTLLVTGSLSGTTAVTVNDGATLGGTGLINTAATVTVADGGILAPGNSPGILNTGSVNLTANSTIQLELGGTTPGNSATNHDQLSVTGTVTLAGNVSVTLFGSYYGTALVNDTFLVILNDGNIGDDAVIGTFAGIAEGGSLLGLDGSQFTVSYIGGDGNDVALTLVSVPEPGAITSLLGGLGVLLGLQRFRRRNGGRVS